jgi:hypothetical protein
LPPGDEYARGVARLARRFAAMTPAVKLATGARVKAEAEAMAEQMRRIAPRDDRPDNGQQVRDRIRVEKGRIEEISAVVISDAKDAKGRSKAVRVELGHMAPDGTKVEPSPSFYPVVRASRRGVKRRIAADMRKAIKREAGL